MIITNHSLQALTAGFQEHFQRGFNELPQSWMQIADTVPSTTASEQYPWLGDWPGMREWVGERHINALKEYGYSLRNKLWEDTVAVPRTVIEDDQYGVYAPRFVAMGRAAAMHPNKLTFGALALGLTTGLAYDGQPFFSASHPWGGSTFSNYRSGSGAAWFLADMRQPIKPLLFQARLAVEFDSKEDSNTSDHVFKRDEFLYGARARYNVGYTFPQLMLCSKETLDSTNLKAAIQVMRSYTDENGDALGINPTHLICGASNEFLARALVANALTTGGASNELAGRLTILDSEWLA